MREYEIEYHTNPFGGHYYRLSRIDEKTCQIMTVGDFETKGEAEKEKTYRERRERKDSRKVFPDDA